ncbi:O-antigen ligase family protein [Belliella kenyensis]|uniref:O-antigen ligase family protein n=1 Tax=Belliella kenyensis TaxID=1472724 RepID=A0ABV8EPV6_9BACT|nr:O-antigen ligase family protein [Belliella kenyensis]MCH7400792.1 O-antigen ligase family protein [Belliella kenyensis]MDN3601920.1 O-antigen ligase family protein [Belliella kenyensis]
MNILSVKWSIALIKQVNLTNTVSMVLLFVVLALLPLSYNKELFYETESIKTILFFILLIPLSIVAFLKHIQRNSNAKLTKIDLTFGLFIFYLLINKKLMGDTPIFSIQYVELISLGFYYLFIRLLGDELRHKALLFIVVGGLIQALYGQAQILGLVSSNHSLFKVTGGFFNPGPLAGYLVSSIILILWLITNKENFKRNLGIASKSIPDYTFGLFLIVLFMIAILISTHSRAGIFSIFTIGLIMFYQKQSGDHLFKRLKNKKTFTGIVLFSFLSIIALVSLYFFNVNSADGRFLIWKVSKSMISDNILFGVGFDNFRAYYMNAQALFFEANSTSKFSWVADDVEYGFNEPLTYVVEQGMIGAVIVSTLFYQVINTPNLQFNQAVKLSLLGILIFSLFSYPLQILPVKLNVVTFIAVLAFDSKEVLLQFERTKQSKPISHLTTSLLLIAILFSIFFHIDHSRFIANNYKKWKIAFSAYQGGDLHHSITTFESIPKILLTDSKLLLPYAKALERTNENQKSNLYLQMAMINGNNSLVMNSLGKSYQNLGMYELAEESYMIAENMIPHKLYPKYQRFLLYEELGQDSLAKNLAIKIMQMPVKIESPASVEIKEKVEKWLAEVN